MQPENANEFVKAVEAYLESERWETAMERGERYVQLKSGNQRRWYCNR